jgi:hypothetical protein
MTSFRLDREGHDFQSGRNKPAKIAALATDVRFHKEPSGPRVQD